MNREETRRLQRRHLIYYLEVYDEDSGALLGHLVDLTTEGLKLISKAPIESGRTFRLHMKLPETFFAEKELHFTAKSLWSSNAVNPDFYDTGFSAELDLKAKDVVGGLVRQFGFLD